MLAALLLIAACSKEPQSKIEPTGPGSTTGSAAMEPGSGATGGTGSGATAGPAGSGTKPAAADGPKIGEPCAADDACGEGACVTYYGIAGPRGPAFKSCEIRCDAQTRCEGARRCVTIADGPGQVCR